MTYTVEVSTEATDDLVRLADPLFEPELLRDGDLDYAANTIAIICASFSLLERFPYTCRKAADSSLLRDLVISFAHTGYAALFEIAAGNRLMVSAIRHQREDDYL